MSKVTLGLCGGSTLTAWDFNGPGPANTFTVVFYSDNDGFPGNQKLYATFASWEAER